MSTESTGRNLTLCEHTVELSRAEQNDPPQEQRNQTKWNQLIDSKLFECFIDLSDANNTVLTRSTTNGEDESTNAAIINWFFF